MTGKTSKTAANVAKNAATKRVATKHVATTRKAAAPARGVAARGAGLQHYARGAKEQRFESYMSTAGRTVL